MPAKERKDTETAPAQPVRGDDGQGNTRPADARFVDRAQVDDRSDQVPVSPGAAATMKPVLDADGRLYPSAANDLPNAAEIKAKLEAEKAKAEQDAKDTDKK